MQPVVSVIVSFLSCSSEVKDKASFSFYSNNISPCYSSTRSVYAGPTQNSAVCYLNQVAADSPWCQWTQHRLGRERALHGPSLLGGEKSLPLVPFLVGRCVSILLKHNTKRLGFIFPRKQVDTAHNLDNSLDSMAWKRPLCFYPLFYLLQCSAWWTVRSWPKESQPLIVLTTAAALGNPSGRVSVMKELEAEGQGRVPNTLHWHWYLHSLLLTVHKAALPIALEINSPRRKSDKVRLTFKDPFWRW